MRRMRLTASAREDVERDDGVVIVRVLHERRELSSILSASSQDHP